MAALVLTNTRILVGSFDATPFSGSFTDAASVPMKDGTTFGNGGYEARYPAQATYSNSIAGFADYASGGIAAAFTPSLLGTQQLVTIVPPGDVNAGDPAIFTRGLIDNIYAPGGPVGEMAEFGMSFTSDTQKIYGQVAAPLAARTATANGSVLTMTGPTASQRVYAGLHITSASGTTPSVTVKIQSATLAGFGSPTDRLTFNAATAAGWQFSSVAGAITDGFWRAVFTISGTTPSFTCAVVLGVAA